MMKVLNSCSRNWRHQITSVVALFNWKRSLHPGSHLPLFTNNRTPYHGKVCNHFAQMLGATGTVHLLRWFDPVWTTVASILALGPTESPAERVPVFSHEVKVAGTWSWSHLVLKLRMTAATLILHHTAPCPAQEQLQQHVIRNGAADIRMRPKHMTDKGGKFLFKWWWVQHVQLIERLSCWWLQWEVMACLYISCTVQFHNTVSANKPE